MNVIALDIGWDGGISDGTTHISMPLTKACIKEARYVFDLDSKGKKQIIKSGKKKGQFKQKQKSPAKYAKAINCKAIADIFASKKDCTIILEQPNHTHGARSAATTHQNYGKLLAIAELSGHKVVTVSASKWKKDLGLPKDKLPCVELAEHLSGSSFRNERGTIVDGPAEAFLIRHHYINFTSKGF